MARYEHDGKFWSIARSVSVVTVTTGKIGNKGRTSTQHLPTPAAATARHDALVIAKQRAGYRLVVEVAPASVEAVDAPAFGEDQGDALEAAITQDPEDPAAYEVYGDWLQRRGDPRGELIALQRAAGADPTPAQRAAIGRYIAKHAPALLGELANLVADLRDPASPPLFWRNGFLHRVELASPNARALAHDLAQVLGHPSGKFLVELVLRAHTDADARGALATIERAAPATLRELDLFARAALDDLGALWPRLAGLRRLAVTARSFELGELVVPAVRRARFLAGSMSAGAMRAIASAPWPVLERLEIRLCGLTGSSEADFHDVRPLLLRADLPALTHLKLRGAPFAGALVRTLVTAPLARQLEVLDLSAGNFSPADIALLAQRAGTFPKLRELWMPFDRMTLAMQGSLRGVAQHVISDARAPIDKLEDELHGDAMSAVLPRRA